MNIPLKKQESTSNRRDSCRIRLEKPETRRTQTTYRHLTKLSLRSNSLNSEVGPLVICFLHWVLRYLLGTWMMRERPSMGIWVYWNWEIQTNVDSVVSRFDHCSNLITTSRRFPMMFLLVPFFRFFSDLEVPLTSNQHNQLVVSSFRFLAPQKTNGTSSLLMN